VFTSESNSFTFNISPYGAFGGELIISGGASPTHPEKLTFLSAYTIEVVSLALLIFSASVGLKRIESLVQISGLNGQLLDAIEKRGAVMASKPNSVGLIVVKYPGRLLTGDAAANWIRELNDKIQVLDHMIEKETTRAESLYKWRNRLLLIRFCGLVCRKFSRRTSILADERSSSRDAVSFSSRRTMKRFPSPRCASTIQVFARRHARHVADPISSIPDYSHVYGTRKSFPVYGSFAMDPDAKPVTSTYFPWSGV